MNNTRKFYSIEKLVKDAPCECGANERLVQALESMIDNQQPVKHELVGLAQSHWHTLTHVPSDGGLERLRAIAEFSLIAHELASMPIYVWDELFYS